MKIIKLLSIILILSFEATYSQNIIINREPFILKLPVDGKQYYKQEIKTSPYFVKENDLQIYPGEKLLIEVKTKKKEIVSMKVVKENLNPKKTIQIEFTQNVKNRMSKSMILKIDNPLKKDLEYEALMYIVGHKKWIRTSVIPVRANLKSFETWPDVIISLVLRNWRLK